MYGANKSIFSEYLKIMAPIRLSVDHIVLIEIRNTQQSYYTGSGLVRQTYPEIILFDSNQKEYRHLHNSLYMIIKRYIYEELLEKTGRSQSECYQESL